MRYITIILYLLIQQNLSAQIDLFDIQYPHKGYVENIYEDEEGKIWIHDGIDFLRYDGDTFNSINITEDLVGASKTINDSDGIFYKKKDSLFHYGRKQKTTTYIGQLDKETSLDFFYKDDAKQIWMFTKNLLKKERKVYKITKDKTLEFAFDIYKHLGDKALYANVELEDAKGLFYFHFLYDGLLIVDNRGNKIDFPINASGKDSACYVYRLDNKNTLWRIYYDIFEVYNANLKRFEKHPISDKITIKNKCLKKSGLNLALKHIFMDSEGRVWLGFEDSNLYMYDEKDNMFLNFKAPLIKELGGKAGDIKNLTEDRNGNIWGNKRGGIFKIIKKTNDFKSYLIKTDNVEHPLYQMNPEHTQRIWSFFGEEYLRTHPAKPQIDSNGNIYAQDQRFSYRILAKNDNLELIPWFHNQGKQYLFFNENFKMYTTWNNYYKIDKDLNTEKILINYPLRSLRVVFVKKDGSIWASGLLHNNNTFLAQLHPETLAIETLFEDGDTHFNFNNTIINLINEDEEGNLWLSTDKGLYKMNSNMKVIKQPEYNYTENDSVRFYQRFNSFKYLENNLGWYVNRYQIGLLNTKTNQLEYYMTNKDLGAIEIFDILPVNTHSFWYCSTTGIGFYDFKTNTKSHFDYTHTLIEDFNVKTLTSRPQTGEIVATSINGIHIFNPDSLLKKHEAKKVFNETVSLILTNYSVLQNENKYITKFNALDYNGETIKLNYDDKLLTFNFELIHYSYPKRHRFIHKLEGYDTDWSAQTSNSYLSYSSLPPGKYTLKIKGSIGGDIWSKNEIVIPIVIEQAWFRKGWFYFLMISLISLIIYGLTRYYYNLKLKQKEELDQLKTKISIDLHDDVGSILTGLSMQSEILEYKANEKDKVVLHRISELSRSAMLRMRDAVWAMDSRKNNWKSLLDRMNEFASETLELKAIDYQIKHNVLAINKDLDNVVRQNLYLIYKEAITNILKHSDADLVIVDIKENDDQLKMLIKDNGSSPAKKFSTSGLGLSNMQHRANEINCELILEQEKGFTIIVKNKSLV